MHISGNYVSRNESTYGIISKVEVDSSLETTAELTAWANERLDKHAQPVVTVTVDGMDLAGATGESLDALTLGRLCRIPLPEFNTTIEERIIELNYRDKKNQPEAVRITLGNQRDDLVHIIANEIKTGGGQSGAGRGGGGGRGGVRQAKEDHAWFEDTDEHVAMCAEGIVGVDAQGNPNWVRLSQLIVDGAGIHGDVTSLLDGALYQQANVEMNESKISLVVGRYNDQNYIKAAEICVAINEAGEGVAIIDADHVYIGNQKSTTVINGKCSLSDVTANYIQAKIETLTYLAVNRLSVKAGGSISWAGNGASITDSIAADLIKNLKIELSGNTYTLSKVTVGDASWQTVGTFSRAVSSWSVGGGSGKVNVTANPQSQTKSVNISVSGSNSITSNGTYTYTAMYENASGDDVSTGATKTVTVNVSSSDRYDEGWNDCRNAMIESQWYWTGYTGTETTKYDAPSVGAQARPVIYPYQSANHYRYSVPDPR